MVASYPVILAFLNYLYYSNICISYLLLIFYANLNPLGRFSHSEAVERGKVNDDPSADHTNLLQLKVNHCVLVRCSDLNRVS